MNRPVAALILALLVAGFYWKIVLTDQFTWLDSPDLAEMYVPRFQFMANEFQHGRIPLWNPNLYMGQPLLAQSQPGVAYPLNWVLFSLPLSHGWVRQLFLHWFFVMTHILAAFAAYRLARDLGCRRGAAVLSGCVYSLSGWMGSNDWPDVLNGGVWAPLVVMHVLRALRGGDAIRAGVFGGFFLGLSMLAGHHQIPIYLSLACAGLWLASLRSVRALAGPILFYGTAAGLAAVQLLPTYEYARRAVRWVSLPDPVSFAGKIPIDVHQMFPFRASDLLGILFPGWWSHADPFLGATALMLAVLGVGLAWRSASVRALGCFAVGALLFSMAGYSLLHGLIYSLVPMADKARNASHAILLFHLAASALAGVGLEQILTQSKPEWLRRVRRTAAGFAALVFTVFAGLVLYRGAPSVGDDRVLAVALAGLASTALLYLHQTGSLSSRSVTALITGVFLFEAGLVTTSSWRGKYDATRPDYYAPHRNTADVADYLRRQPGYPRVDVDADAMSFNFGDLHDIPQTKGFVAGVTSNIYQQELHTAPVLNMFGVAYGLRKEPNEIFRELVFTSRSGAKLYRNPDAFPRTWAVHEILSMPGREFLPFWMKDTAHDWRRSAFAVGQLPALEPCSSPDTVEITSYQADRVRVQTSMACTGLVVLSDTMYPGWEASVDGQPARVYEVYGSMRGTVVPAGRHELVFRFRPVSVYTGASISVLALAGVISVLLRRRGV